jgi:hypothetical protein
MNMNAPRALPPRFSATPRYLLYALPVRSNGR